jgi:hypothetical protein
MRGVADSVVPVCIFLGLGVELRSYDANRQWCIVLAQFRAEVSCLDTSAIL